MKKFAQAFREVLQHEIVALHDFELNLIDSEIADGWQCFHPYEAWMKEVLPLPLVNDMGKKFNCEGMREKLSSQYEELGSRYISAFQYELLTAPDKATEYRNYLSPGGAAFQWASIDGGMLDHTAEKIFHTLVNVHHRHAYHEVRHKAKIWLLEAQIWGTMTPPICTSWNDVQPPVRDEALSLNYDTAYWRNFYDDGQSIVSITYSNNPEWTRRMMASIAPDFPYSDGLSSKKRLVFKKKEVNGLSWAVVFDWDGYEFSFPPSLVLIDGWRKKWDDDISIYKNMVLERSYMQFKSMRSGELCLLCCIPRFRKLEGFYESRIKQALLGQ